MRVAVTGGRGFIGKKLVDSLVARGDSVRVLTRQKNTGAWPGVEIVVGDLTYSGKDLTAFLDGIDVLYNCAAESGDSSKMFATNVEGTKNLAQAARGMIGRWVQLSSVGVYGPAAKGAITEDSVLNPVGQYEITKAESDKIVIGAASKGGFSYSILRPSNVFGAGMVNQSLFSMIAMIERGFFFYIGKPGASANYIHVANVAEALVCCGTMQPAKGRVYDLSDHSTMEHFVEVIADALGRISPRLRIPEPIAYLTGSTLGKIPGFPLTRSRVDALVNRSIYPISRIQRELGYNHIISMEDGLRELVAAYKIK